MTASEWDNLNCLCECHDDDYHICCSCHEDGYHEDGSGCPREIRVDAPMSAEMIKTLYLRLQATSKDTEESHPATYPLVDDLDSLLPLLSNAGLFEWAKHVRRIWGSLDHSRSSELLDSSGRRVHKREVLNGWLKEIDSRFRVPLPNERNWVRLVLAKRDGLGCVCRRPRPDCGFQRDSDMPLADYEIAHLLPKSLGGKDVWSNLALISPRCNKSQGGKHFVEWLNKETGRRTYLSREWNEGGPKTRAPSDLIAAVRFAWWR